MPVPPTGHSSSIDSSSSYASSSSSLLVPPVDAISSQSDISAPSMPRGDISAYALAASPSQSAYRTNNPAVSASQKFKRAFVKRRKPSQHLLTPGDERAAPDIALTASSHVIPQSAGNHPSSARPKLTMHLFGGRKPIHSVQDLPPSPPPKPAAMHATSLPPLYPPATVASKPLINMSGVRPYSSIMPMSPSINPAIEFMRKDEEHQRSMEQGPQDFSAQQLLEQNKEDWRKSDSTVASGHTVRPLHPADIPPGTNTKRRSTYSGSPNIHGGLGLDFRSDTEASTSDEPADPSTGIQTKRRSLSLNPHVTPQPLAATSSSTATSTQTSSPSSLVSPSTGPHLPHSPSGCQGSHSSHSVPLSPAPQDTPTLTRTAANGIISPGTALGSSANKTNTRGRLAALTATASPGARSSSPFGVASSSSSSFSSPSVTSLNQQPHRRIPVTSTASQPPPELQAIAAVREIQNRSRSPSASSTGAFGIRQAATSLTSGASAMALGLGKRAYEKVGRVWAGSGSGSGSGSDLPNHNHSAAGAASGTEDALYSPRHGPSAYPTNGRHSQNAPSGTWSVSSVSGGSRSSSEREQGSGRDISPSGPGRLIRPPRNTGCGIVFGRELWECVRETRVAGSVDPTLTGRMIPALVLRCAQYLHRWGVQEEGLFRISGRSSHINRLRHEFDSGADHNIIDCSPSELDPHAVASIFKAYLRELPEPILTRALAPLFDNAMNAESNRVVHTNTTFISKPVGTSPGLPSGPRAVPMIRKPPSLSTFTLPTSTSLRSPSTSLVETLRDLVARLPRENHDLLLTVVELMQATASRSKETKMPLSNLLLVFCPSLSMGPTLLRALCDAPGVWEPIIDPFEVNVTRPPPAEQAESDESDDSDSDSVSSYENAEVVSLPQTYKEAETSGEDTRPEVITQEATIDDVELPVRPGVSVSVSLARPRPTRRMPVATLHPEEQHLYQISPVSSRSPTPPLPMESQLRFASASSPSLSNPNRSMTPLSAVSLTSMPALESPPMVPPLRNRQFSSPLPSSGFTPLHILGAPDHNKDLPASPMSPQFPVHAEDESKISNKPPPRAVAGPLPEQSRPRVTPLIPSSRSAPSVVFPSVRTPTSPILPKKQTSPRSLGRQTKISSDGEGLSSPSKRMIRRPSLNLLFNMKRSGSPSPRSRTPTISSPLSIYSPISTSPSVESSPRTATNPLPPVLTLPSLETSTDVGLGLGWDDVFGNDKNSATTLSLPSQPTEPPQPRPTAISQPSSQSPRLQTPPSTPRRPTTEFLLSSGGFFSANGPPLALPSPTSVLEAANMGAGAQAASLRDDGAEIIVWHEDMSSTPNSPDGDFAIKGLSRPPPLLNFQLDKSSMEDEDWANTVLMAAHKPSDSLI